MPKETAREVLEKIAAFPLTKEMEYDEHGDPKPGASSYREGYAAWRIKQMAEHWVAANCRAKSSVRGGN